MNEYHELRAIANNLRDYWIFSNNLNQQNNEDISRITQQQKDTWIIRDIDE